jgi:probable O-glycosylation ligase (exosortase A-associated)
MRDLMFALMMVVAIPLAIARPLNAYLLWGWTAVVVPTSYFYGFMADARLNFFFALLTLLLILFGRVSLAGYQNNRVTWLYLAFLVHGTLAFFLAFPGNPINAQYYEIFVKGLFFCLVMPIFIRERVHIQAFLIVLVLGLALHGVLNGLKTLASGGAHNMIGPQGTMIGDRNHLSTALVLSLPLLFYLYQYTRSNLMRWGFLGGFILVVLAVVGSGSRGGFIALAVVAVWLVLASRRRWTVLFVTVPLAALIYVYAPAEWFSRLETIETADEDASFLGRVIAWKVSSAIAIASPIFGGGFRAVQVQAIWDQFKVSPGLFGFLNLPVPDFSAKAAHSIYFEIMGDLGFVGLMIFLSILLYGIYCRFVIKRQVRGLGVNWLWAHDMADMLMLAIIAYMAGGAAVSLGYFEVIYMVVMLMEMLRLQVNRAAAAMPTPKGAAP